MTVFILTPKDELNEELAALFPEAGAGDRAERIELLESVRQSDPQAGDLIERIDTKRTLGFDLIADGVRDLPLTGVTILEADEDALETLQEAFPNHLVFAEDIGVIDDIDANLSLELETTYVRPWHLEAIGVKDARQDGFELDGDGVTVAVIDSGIAPIADLAGRTKPCAKYDPTSRKLIAHGISEDSFDHGTPVADLIAGTTYGVAPACHLIDIHAAPKGIVYSPALFQAFELVAGNKEISIANISAGRPGLNDDLKSAFQTMTMAGVLAIAAVGNDGQGKISRPGGYRAALSVGAIDVQNALYVRSGSAALSDSQGDYKVPKLVAPGVDVVATNRSDQPVFLSGTSMAAPIVTGMAALIKQRFPNAAAHQVRSLLVASTQRLAIADAHQGAGLLRVPSQILPSGAMS